MQSRTPVSFPRPRERRTPALYDLTFEDISERTDNDIATDLYRRLYRGSPSVDEVRAIADRLQVPVEGIRELSASRGARATKYVFGLADGSAVETVRIRRRTGVTACVSSQVGCAYRCRFCASGQEGLVRHLTTGEIVQQVMALGPRINRVVFMGIGEPLHNYDNVLAAIRVLRDRRGRALSTKGITISTIGVPRTLRRLREEHLGVNLTVSLHATTDEVRHALIPGSRNHAIEEVVAASLSWGRRHNRTVTFVYLLLPGVNDGDADIARLVEWFAGAPARINLMRWNPIGDESGFRRIDDRGLSRIRSRLLAGGVPTIVRDTQGRDVEAACGQLVARSRRRRP